MGADHTRPTPSAPPRVRRILVVTVVPLFLATLLLGVSFESYLGRPSAPGVGVRAGGRTSGAGFEGASNESYSA